MMQTYNWVGARAARKPSKIQFLKSKLQFVNWKKFMLITFVLLAIISVFLFLSRSNIFSIKIVEITGTECQKLKYTKESDLYDQVSWVKGSGFFNIDFDKIAVELKSKNNFIKDVISSKDFPDKVKIVVIERDPKFVFNINNSDCKLVEGDGFVVNVDIDITQCKEITSDYASIYVDIINPLNPFVKGIVSNAYIVTKLNELAQLLNSKNYTIDRIVVKDEYCEITLVNQKILVFAINNSLDVQVARFQILLPELEKNFEEFKILDLRYDRPVKRN